MMIYIDKRRYRFSVIINVSAFHELFSTPIPNNVARSSWHFKIISDILHSGAYV
jgi:hypothetical protein